MARGNAHGLNCLGESLTAPHLPSHGTLGMAFDLLVSQLPHP